MKSRSFVSESAVTLLSRRTIVAAGLGAAWPLASAETAVPTPLRVGLTPVFLDNQVAFLNQWRAFLERELQRPVAFIQRGSYRDVTAMLLQSELDFAWLCGYPFVRNQRRLRVLAVPLYQGRPLYQSYLIVPARDHTTTTLLDLRGRVFAYADPDSNSGHLYTQHALLQMREAPTRFFAKTFFTWGHRKVVEAVAAELAQGGAVDGYVWDTLARLHPELTARTRIVEKSPSFGFPPFVAHDGVSEQDVAALRSVLLQMRDSAAGAELLQRLNLDGFVTARAALYDSVAAMSRAVNREPT